MNKEEFIKLFELNVIYEEYKEKIPFSFSLYDKLIGSETFIFFGFDKDHNIRLSIECFEFSEEKKELDICFIIDNKTVRVNKNQLFKNEIFHFLTFNESIDSDLKFVANFITKILKPKYHLMGRIYL